MSPNSRPPLTSRIRASFDGKRSKSTEITSPVHTNGFVTQDPDSLRMAIDEAINSETFQKAIAANLANLIKPSIKSALDTIQPVVEAVYSHQLLLRKTNQSVEDILLRLDEKGMTISRRESLVDPLDPEPDGGFSRNPVDEGNVKTPTQETPGPVPGAASTRDISENKQLLEDDHANTTSVLAELSAAIGTTNGKIAEALQGISDVDTMLHSTSESIKSLKGSSEQSHTTISVLQAQIDQLKEDIGQIMVAVGDNLGKDVQAIKQRGAPDTSLLDAHTSKLDMISTDLAAMKEHSKTAGKIDALATELSSLKASVEASLTTDSEGFTGLGSQISTVVSILEGQNGILGEIRDKGPHAEILRALQQSNDSHASHASALGEIKERALAIPAVSGSEVVGSSNTTADLDDLKSNLAALRENIEAGLASNNENMTSVGVKVEKVLSTIEGHKASDPSADILAAVQQSNESHTSHTAILYELKSRDHTTTSPPDTSDLVARIEHISQTMNAHTATLHEIKAVGGIHASTLEKLKTREVAPSPAATMNTSDLTSQLNTISETIIAHTATLDEIKAASGSHSAALESHGDTLEGLKSTTAAPQAAVDSVDIAPLEAHITSIVSILGEHSEALNEIKTNTGDHKTALELHGTALDEIKSLTKDAPPSTLDNSALETRMAGLATVLESHTSALDEIKSTGTAHKSALEGHGSALEGLRSIGGETAPAPSTVDFAGLEGHITAIVGTLENHTTSLEELKAANQSHTSTLTDIQAHNQTHASVLDEIKTATSIHTSALDETKSPNIPPVAAIESAGLAALEIQIASIAHTLDAQTAALQELKPQASLVSTDPESTEIIQAPSDGQSDLMTTIIETLEMHTTLLNEMKEDVSAEILSTLHDLSQSQANQNNLLAEIREADMDDEILTLLHAIGENHTTHTSDLAELKVRSADAGGTSVDMSGVEAKVDGLEAQLSAITAALEEHKNTLSDMKNFHIAHGASLEEMKSKSMESVPAPVVDLSGLEAQLALVTTSLEEHKTMLSAMKDLHTSRGVSLDEIKSKSIEPVPSHIVDLSGLDAQLADVTASLQEHKTTLAELKELHTSHGASLEEIKTRSVDAVPPQPTDLSSLEAHLTAINAALEDHKATLSDVKSTGLASHELHIAHASALDDMKARSIDHTTVTPAVDISGLEAKISSISAAIEEIKATPAEHSAPVDISGLETQLAGLTGILEQHNMTLSEIKDASLASKDMHAVHATSLDEIKSRSIEPSSAPIDLSGLETHLNTISATLDEHKSMLSTIAEGTANSNTSHLAHASILGEIKDASLASNEYHSTHAATFSDIKDATSSWNEAHSANAFTLAEIKDAAFASNDSHASHDTALRELKDDVARANEAHALHTAAFTELKSIQPSATSAADANVDLSPIEGHLTSIISTLENQTATLTEIKDSTPELLAQTVGIYNLLSSHTALLDEIKDSSSHDDINSNISDLKYLISGTHAEHSNFLKDLHNSTTESHSSLSTAIDALALGGAAGAGITALSSHYPSSEDLLTSLNEKVSSLTTQLEINHTTTVTSLTTLSDEIKAEIDATGTDISTSITALRNDFSPLQTIDSKLESLETSVKQNGSFVVGLYEGVHLNDTGIGQFQEQLAECVFRDGNLNGESTPAQTPAAEGEKEGGLEVLDEATWFKKKGVRRGTSPSPLRAVETVSPPSEVEEAVDEEDMPSIEKLLGVSAAVAVSSAAAAVALHESNDDIKESERGEEATLPGKDLEREVPSNESKDLEPAPVEEESIADDNATPEILGHSILSKPEVEAEQEIEALPDVPAKSTDTQIEPKNHSDTDLIESDAPVKLHTEKEADYSHESEIENESELPEVRTDLKDDSGEEIVDKKEIVDELELHPEAGILAKAEMLEHAETRTELEIHPHPELPTKSATQVEPESSEQQESQRPRESLERAIDSEEAQDPATVGSEPPNEHIQETNDASDLGDDPESLESTFVEEDAATEIPASDSSKHIEDGSHLAGTEYTHHDKAIESEAPLEGAIDEVQAEDSVESQFGMEDEVPHGDDAVFLVDDQTLEHIHEESTQPTTEDPSEAGGAFIDELHGQLHIPDESHFELPSSPFIEEPESQSPKMHFEPEHLKEAQQPALEFKEPHPSRVLEQRSSPTLHDQI